MKLLTIGRKELKDIISNKIYILLIVAQLFILLGAYGMAFVSSMALDDNLADEWRNTQYIQIGIVNNLNNSPIFDKFNETNFEIVMLKDVNEGYKLFNNRMIGLIRKDPDGNLVFESNPGNLFYILFSKKINEIFDSYYLEQELKNEGYTKSEIKTIIKPINLNISGVNENSKIKIKQEKSYFVEIMYGIMIPFILLLPFFLGSNMVTDSIVGEKERKTFEVLLMTPIKNSTIIISKVLPILLFSLAQSIIWMLILILLEVPILHIIPILILTFFVGLAFIGSGIVISMLVDSTKEANAAIAVFLFFATFILYVPLFLNITSIDNIINFIPTVIMVTLSSTQFIDWTYYLRFIPTILISTSIFLISIVAFKRERAIRL